MAGKAAPEGFEVVPYPNLATEQDEDLYVCTTCRPQWDTFDAEAAKAHAAAGVHYPQPTTLETAP